MMKYFSVTWLAQSHHHHHRGAAAATTEERGAGAGGAPTCRPHVPCMVQPNPPTFGTSYLQTKPKASQRVEHMEPEEQQDSSLASPLRPERCASPISENSGYSSGYESEAASSECLSVDEGSEAEKGGRQRRARTKFTTEQIGKLEKIFNKHKYLDAGERVKTAQKLGLTETQVRTWFQNRRMKLKREVQDYLAPRVQQVTFQPVAPGQYQCLAGQRPHYAAASRAFYPLPAPQMLIQQQMAHHHHHHPPHLIVHHPHFY